MLVFIIVVLTIIVTILEKKLKDIEIKQNEDIMQEIDYKDNYYKKDYLLTQTELKFYRLLKQITDELGYSLFCQVSLYEIVNSRQFKDFAKIKSKSIDFVITQENCKILMCIELDDKTHERHKRIQRDIFLDKLFNDLGIKLLRIQVQNFYDIEKLKNKVRESL